jgi:ligand-binding sensor domain-containing protein/two-component sensor histidine kinase
MQFKVFLPENAPGLPSNRILALFEAHDGSLWIGTEDGALARYHSGQVQTIMPGQGESSSSAVRTIVAPAEDDAWILTYDWQLRHRTSDGLTTVSTNWNLRGTHVFGLCADISGKIWIGTDYELAVWEKDKFIPVWDRSKEEGFTVSALGRSRRGGCWVLARDHLRRFAEGAWQADAGVFASSRAIVNGLCETRSGELWLGTYGNGLWCYQTNGATLHFAATNGLPNDFVRCFQEDHEGNLWIGTEGGGLARLKPTIFQSFDRSQGLSGDCVLSVCEGADGEIWIGTNGDGIDRLKDGHIRHYGAEDGLTNEFVWSLCEDHKHRLWAGTWGGGLFRLEGKHFSPVPYAGSGPEPVVCALYEDASRCLWIGQQQPELRVLQVKHDRVSALTLPTSHPRADVRAAVQDSTGSLWLGTFDDGLYQVKGGVVRHFGKSDGLKSERIRALYADHEGSLWIGTSRGGLNRFHDGRFAAFTKQDGLADDLILHIEEDRSGYLWCSSGIGVFRVARQELEKFERGEIQFVNCFVYTKADGLPSIECSGASQPCGCKSRDGRLWFPTVSGLAVVAPDEVKINPLPPPVAIEEVIVDGGDSSAASRTAKPQVIEPLLSTEPLKVLAGRQRFEFHYTALSFSAPEKVRFKYRLDGLEDAWVDAGNRREAHYSHLVPGTYTFHVIACNDDGIWNDSGAAFVMMVLPHFWQTWAFRVLVGVACLLLFVGIYEVRLAAQRRVANLRLRIARDLHDEVGSNLGTIALLSQVLGRNQTAAGREVSEISRVAAQTIESLRDIVWFLDPATDNPQELVGRMEQTARTMLHGVSFQFHSSIAEGTAAPSLELRRNVIPMFKEILHNINRHAQASRVDIRCEFSSREFLLQIQDNGVGFDENKVRAGNGLRNLRRRAGELGGNISIVGRENGGTTIILKSRIP